MSDAFAFEIAGAVGHDVSLHSVIQKHGAWDKIAAVKSCDRKRHNVVEGDTAAEVDALQSCCEGADDEDSVDGDFVVWCDFAEEAGEGSAFVSSEGPGHSRCCCGDADGTRPSKG